MGRRVQGGRPVAYAVPGRLRDLGQRRPAGLRNVAAGTVDVGSSSSIPPIFASQTTNHGNFKVVAASETQHPQPGHPRSQGIVIASVADLKGKKVGYVPNTTAEYFLLKQLQAGGLSFSDIAPVELSTSKGLSALLGGSIAAFADYGTTVIAGQAPRSQDPRRRRSDPGRPDGRSRRGRGRGHP